MVLKLIGWTKSTATRRVATVLYELGVPYELVPIDVMADEQKDASFTAHQPFGQVPYIVEEDGFTLYESRAIARYVARVYGEQGALRLMPDPADLCATARFEQAVSVEMTNFDPFAFGILFENIIRGMRGMGETDHKLVARMLEQLDEKLDGYEAILSKSRYLAGDDITLADLFHLPHGAALAKMDIDIMTVPQRPNVARWWNDIISRPSWQTVKDGA